ncbi:MAG TPA: hypothetical protein VJN50_00085 [Actinomycetota bacterium]|nr:hypothetical protein [Actinomycetota bacterium]
MKTRLAALGVLLAVSLQAQPARAASCTFDPDSATVTVTFRKEVSVRRNGDTILIKGKPCEAATVTNVDLVRFVAPHNPAASQAVRINLTGGPFAPGATDEGDGASEIEFVVDTGAGGDGILIKGTTEADHFVVAPGGVNLNADEESSDIDVMGLGVVVYGRRGADLLSTASARATLRGGPGDDALVGSAFGGGLFYGGGTGHDSLDYSNVECAIEVSAMAYVFGCPIWESYDVADSVEEMIGTAYDDVIEGSTENEVLRGRGGDDFLHGRRGRDILDGGAGTDTCEGGGGGDTLIRCEA